MVISESEISITSSVTGNNLIKWIGFLLISISMGFIDMRRLWIFTCFNFLIINLTDHIQYSNNIYFCLLSNQAWGQSRIKFNRNTIPLINSGQEHSVISSSSNPKITTKSMHAKFKRIMGKYIFNHNWENGPCWKIIPDAGGLNGYQAIPRGLHFQNTRTKLLYDHGKIESESWWYFQVISKKIHP